MFCLSSSALIQAAEVPHLISLTVAEVGDNFTFMCQFPTKKYIFFYKQSLGHMIQSVAAVVANKIKVSEEFKDSRFTVTEEANQYFLSIRNISKEDEATYYCLSGAKYSEALVNGTFLAVNGKLYFQCLCLYECL